MKEAVRCAGVACGREREIERQVPGMTVYKPCAVCGCIAIKRVELQPQKVTLDWLLERI